MGHLYEDKCCKPKSCCKEKSKKDCYGSGCDMTDHIVKIADRAWEHLMLEKMKAHLEKKRGEKMNGVAAAAVDASLTKWANKMKVEADKRVSVSNLQKAFM